MAQKKVRTIDLELRRDWIDPQDDSFSITRQCELAEVSRASYYREPATESEENLQLMRQLDELTETTVRALAGRRRCNAPRRGESALHLPRSPPV